MPKVDPFIPVPDRQRPVRRTPPAHAQTSPRPLPRREPPRQSKHEPGQSGRVKKIALQALQIALFVGLFILGLLLRSVLIGQAVIILYAIMVFVLKIESRTSFILAVMALAVVLIAIIRSDMVLAGTFATYAFLLLIIGVISLGREVRDEV